MVIYCDFSGYTDMARGIARWMGFDIRLNFNFPYRARNIGEFWRRWHISLSSWLRDDIFMPVAMKLSALIKRDYLVSGKFIRADLVIFTIAAMITFTLCGVWHGNGLNFLVWGALHGAALSVQKLWSVKTMKFKQKRTAGWRKFHRTTGVLLTFSFVSASWVFFRFPTPEESLRVFSQVAGNFGLEAFPAFMAAYYPVLAMLAAGYLLHFAPEKLTENIKANVQRLGWPSKAALAIVVLLVIVYFQNLESAMPIYIQF
jgi:D-alanyl-lipoteichoic acid acyltransferase DltB (MBOAT superfamily)